MFKCKMRNDGEGMFRDKMITIIDLYRKEYNEKIKDIKHTSSNDDNKIEIVFYFDNEITLEFQSVDDNYGNIIFEIDNDNKKLFDERYEFIKKTIKDLNN